MLWKVTKMGKIYLIFFSVTRIKSPAQLVINKCTFIYCGIYTSLFSAHFTSSLFLQKNTLLQFLNLQSLNMLWQILRFSNWLANHLNYTFMIIIIWNIITDHLYCYRILLIFLSIFIPFFIIFIITFYQILSFNT